MFTQRGGRGTLSRPRVTRALPVPLLLPITHFSLSGWLPRADTGCLVSWAVLWQGAVLPAHQEPHLSMLSALCVSDTNGAEGRRLVRVSGEWGVSIRGLSFTDISTWRAWPNCIWLGYSLVIGYHNCVSHVLPLYLCQRMMAVKFIIF